MQPNLPMRYYLFILVCLCALPSFSHAQKILRTEVYFEFGKDKLLPEALHTLDTFWTTIKGIRTAKLYAKGHTDSIGSLSSNDDLGVRRAARVASYYLDKGWPDDRTKHFAAGETEPRADNGKGAGRALNRRVTLTAFYEYFYTDDNDFHPDYAIGATVKLETNFDFNSPVLRDDCFPLLDDMVDTLLAYPELKVEIGGHTAITAKPNGKGKPELSVARANSVRDYLISKGVNPSRLVPVGYKGDRPICRQYTKESCLKLNRRVEVTIIGK